MLGYLPKKELIFFTPGKSGLVFARPANHYISIEQLLKVQERLVLKMKNSVVYIEDRREKQRQFIPTDFLSNIGRRHQMA
ncbi:MAG: hypothetical protein GY699_01870 [Desulfobacteraceae bacterium]|nr:hypothetical protein [Desulfobacteraceae bacterium]